MTYRKLYEDALFKLDHNIITLGEFEEMTKSLDREVEQEPQTFKWCTDCREYDQEKHCCHRWSKVIRDTVEEMKQEYIEREALNKIRAEIECLETYYDNDYFSGNKDAMFKRSEVLDILDKYKAEKEDA